MNKKNYLLNNLWEWACCWIVSVCCGVCLAEGFFVPDAWLGKIAPALIPCFLTLCFMAAAAFSRRNAAAAAAVSVPVLIVFILMMLRGGESTVSRGLYLLICAAVTAGVFLLSRTRPGCAAAFLSAAYILCGNAFMAYGRHPFLMVTGMLAVAALYFIRRYQIVLRGASARRASGGRAALSAGALCLTAALLAGGTAALVFAPLQLPTVRVKLVTELSGLYIIEKLGVSSMVPLMDPEETARGNEGTIITGEEGEPEPAEAAPDAAMPPQGESGAPELTGGPELTGRPFDAEAVRYTLRSILPVLVPLLIIGIAAGTAGGKILLRRRRRDRLLALPDRERTEAVYQYVLRMFSRLKMGPAASETPLEYCARVGRRMDGYLGGEDRLMELSGIFMKASYGAAPLGESEKLLCESIYREFPERLRRRTGLPGYLRYFFFT